MNDRPTSVTRNQATDAERHAAIDAGLDSDTIEHGTTGPFDYWESDHTALVHVLWNAKHAGLTLQDNADEIASLINRSRWLAAHNAKVIAAADKARLDAEELGEDEVAGSAS